MKTKCQIFFKSNFLMCKHIKVKPKNFFCLCLMLVVFCAYTACNDNDADSQGGYDPNAPIVFDDFSPKSGAARTQCYIRGNNFGTDLSRIHLKIGGVDTKIIGSTGKEIYCMIPPKAFDGEISLSFTNADGDTINSYTFPEKFEYKSQRMVGTIIRQVDEKGKTQGDITGPWDIASVNQMDFMAYQYVPGDHRYAYMGANTSGVRRLDLDEQTLELVLPFQHNMMISFAFSAEGDTLFVPDRNYSDDNDQPNVYYSVRSNNFRKLMPYCYGPSAISVCSHPTEYTFFYLEEKDGTLYKKDAGPYDPVIGKNKDLSLFNLNAFKKGNLVMNLFVHPSGKYMYLMGSGMPCILRSEYNFDTHEFEPPIIFCGNPNSTGYKESTGTDALLGGLNKSGVFAKNPQYETKGKEDLYDFYFADPNNHCVRKVTPEGSTSLFAGRGNFNQDGKANGYVDGDPIEEARFNSPRCITYDPVDDRFYIGDLNNYAVRYIAVE